jgi:hypothetical protein
MGELSIPPIGGMRVFLVMKIIHDQKGASLALCWGDALTLG